MIELRWLVKKQQFQRGSGTTTAIARCNELGFDPDSNETSFYKARNKG